VSLRERLGAIEGLGALLEVDADKPFVCGKVCMALRSETAASDERVAAAARRVLGRGGDPTVVADLIADLELGTQLLRAEAATALTPFVGRGDDSAVVQALIGRLRDPSAVVQEAALRTLLPRAADPQVRQALAGLQQYGSGLSYAVDQALAGTATPTAR
jgi:HEAT repeat protein